MSLDLGDPRAITQPVYEALNNLRTSYNTAKDQGEISPEDYQKRLREQKSQTQELYTYLATWGLMRLRAEEMSRNGWEKPPSEIPLSQRAKKNQEGKREAIDCFFQCLEKIAKTRDLAEQNGIDKLNELKTEDYIGLTGIALAVAREFSFWADAIYPDIKGSESE
jgi:hypothetical protein